MKLGTRDECRTCGRLIEWEEAPLEENDLGRDIRPYWRRKPAWVDVEPPGEEVWNVSCEITDQPNPFGGTGSHAPKKYCNQSKRDDDMCNARVTDDTEGLGACKTHIKAARAVAKRAAVRESTQHQQRWVNESYDARIHKLKQIPNLYVYPATSSWVPREIREHGVMVDTTVLLNCIDNLQLQIEELKREINGDTDPS